MYASNLYLEKKTLKINMILKIINKNKSTLKMNLITNNKKNSSKKKALQKYDYFINNTSRGYRY